MDDESKSPVVREFMVRQRRQAAAIAAALAVMIVCAVVYKRPEVFVFGEVSKSGIFAVQVIMISAFFAFTMYNWRCPACKRNPGPNLERRRCRKCGAQIR